MQPRSVFRPLGANGRFKRESGHRAIVLAGGTVGLDDARIPVGHKPHLRMFSSLKYSTVTIDSDLCHLLFNREWVNLEVESAQLLLDSPRRHQITDLQNSWLGDCTYRVSTVVQNYHHVTATTP